MSSVLQRPQAVVDYPTSDGRPMAETDLHRAIMMDVIETLQGYFASQPDVYVSGNLMVYYVEGNPRVFRSPDVFVVRGVPNRERRLYKTWEEGKFPQVVIEITSKSTSTEDLEQKHDIYQDLWQVPEYFLFDPFEEYLSPSLIALRLADHVYEPIPAEDGRFFSEELGLYVYRDGRELAFWNPTTRQRVRRPDVVARMIAEQEREAAESRAASAEARAAAERAAREQLEAELAALRRQLAATPPPAEG